MTNPQDALNEAVARETGEGRFQAKVSTAGTEIIVDEPVDAGGLGSGPTPYQLLASALAACTTMTLRLYAERKGWPVRNIRTAVGHHREEGKSPADVFVRRVSFAGELDAEQRARLIEIADRCPVHRTLTGAARVETKVGEGLPPASPSTTHMVDMEALIHVGRGSYDFTER
ncbi:OsmC family protein [Sphingomonas montanisoli]|uniref:OsmC family protein n=1 Tax=Sphingomonas montanisoli TaxID=2606412 RepID=A0A5D9C1T4_9SPHN|nr:OsmC family protein [Sphingomonas montanisoli]TZG25828.1 OsmC family protein [Sphingomonas montanisoli]